MRCLDHDRTSVGTHNYVSRWAVNVFDVRLTSAVNVRYWHSHRRYVHLSYQICLDFIRFLVCGCNGIMITSVLLSLQIPIRDAGTTIKSTVIREIIETTCDQARLFAWTSIISVAPDCRYSRKRAKHKTLRLGEDSNKRTRHITIHPFSSPIRWPGAPSLC